MICCNKKVDIIDVIPLSDSDIFADRKIFIGVCSNCKKIKYQLREYNTIKNQYEYDRNKPKRIKNVSQWIENLTALKTDAPIQQIKKGNRSAMAFIFGVNKETKNRITQTGYNFNGTERTKTIKEAKIFSGVE